MTRTRTSRDTELAFWMLLFAALLLALAGCATPDALYADGCSTDTECEEQCMADLRPDEDAAVCAVSLAVVDR